MTDARDAVVGIIRERGLIRFAEPVTLSSGEKSCEFVDAKAGLSRGEDLELACRALIDEVGDVEFDAVGGLTMGADQFAHVMAVLARKQWFVVRKAPKGRGTNQRVEGAKVGAGWRVVLVEDAVTTGGSIQQACEVVQGLGAEVTCALTLIDRGDSARAYFEERSIPYRPLMTYRDLDIAPVVPGASRAGDGL
jgi:orotate phosphoribosyltransferase